MPLLFLIRHGQTAWSLSGQHTSRSDIPLTDAGRREAERLGSLLRGIEFARVLTSPRQRAIETCRLAGLTDAAIEPDLAEWDYGEYEGVLSSEIRRSRPGWDIFMDGCPGGESPADMMTRMDRLIARLDVVAGNVALVAHGHFGRCLGVRWIGLPIAAGVHLALDTASLSILGHDAHRPHIRVLQRWNTLPA